VKARLFKATLKRVRGTRVRRKVWRELAVPDRADLYRLGKGIVEAFGLFFDHPFGFYDDLSDPYRAARQYELFVDLDEEEADEAGEAFELALAETLLALNVADRAAWVEALADASVGFLHKRLRGLDRRELERGLPLLRQRFREAFLELFGSMGPAALLAYGRSRKRGVKGVTVARVFPNPGDRMAMIFDYGDEWVFEVEYLGPIERKKGDPWVLRARGEPPPQYPD